MPSAPSRRKTPRRRSSPPGQARSGKPLKAFFNTSGLLYKSLNLKERLPAMSEEEQLALLATDGMLVKRPLAVCGDVVLAGFRPAEWERLKEAFPAKD